ncbi:MAG: choice-of-anchor Q domain-containing protein [Acidobacteriota bacterium]
MLASLPTDAAHPPIASRSTQTLRGPITRVLPLWILTIQALLFPPLLLAADIDVTTTDDTLAGPGCSLRAALRASDLDLPVGGCAAGSPGADRVLVPAGVYALLPGDPGGSPDDVGDLEVAGPVEVFGDGAGLTIIEAQPVDGGASDRLFEVLAGGALALDGLTLRGGRAELGGGLFVGRGAELVLRDCRLTDNEASSGGGAYLESATVAIEGCELLGNRSAAGGALFQLQGALTLREGRLALNEARPIDPWTDLPGASGGGGALAALGGSTRIETTEVADNRADDTRWGGGGVLALGGSLDVVRSTLAGNSATDALADGGVVDSAYGESGGGAIGAWDATVRLVNSTFSANEANRTLLGGGGLLSVGSEVAVRHITFWDNSADGARRVEGNPAGGSAALFPGPEPTQLDASIFAGASPAECSVAGSETIGGDIVNAIGDQSCGGAPSVGAVTGLDTTLGDRGGPTPTHRLFGASNAVDAGEAECVDGQGGPLLFDQRGVPRPQDGFCDLGAVELTTAIPIAITGLASSEVTEPGGRVDATLTLENLGPLAVTAGLSPGGVLTGLGTCGAAVTLDPGSSTQCQVELTVEGNAGPLGVTVPVATETADATDTETVPIDLEILDAPPTIQLEASVKPGFLEEPGADATLKVTVTNAGGAEAISVVSLVDEVSGPLGGDCASITTLEPGASATCELVVFFGGAAGEQPARSLEVAAADDEGNSTSDRATAGPQIVNSGSIIFQDCFESGDLSAWSSVTP